MSTENPTRKNAGGRSHGVIPLYVELHSPASTYANEQVFAVSNLIKRIEWSDSVTAPYGGCSFTIRIPRSSVMHPVLPRPGMWVVIRKSENTPALWFGHISRVTSGIHGGPAIKALDYQVEAENWFQFLHRSQMYVFPGLSMYAEGTRRLGQNMGTLFDVKGWAEMFTAFDGMGSDESKTSRKPGAILARMLRIIARVRLPGSLMGNNSASDFSRNINVVYDKESAEPVVGIPKDPDGHDYAKHGSDQYTRVGPNKREIDPLIGFSMNSMQSVNPVSGTSVLDFVNGTFQADNFLMEMFPSLEDPAEGGAIAQDSLPSDEEIERRVQRLATLFGGDEAAARQLVDISVGQSSQVASVPTPISQYLKKNLCLFYRMRPWRTEPVWVYGKHRASRHHSAKSGQPVGRGISKEMFTETTWKPSKAAVVPSDHVISLNYSREDVQRANVLTTSLPMSGNQALAFEEMGLPVFNLPDLRDQGARFMNVNWPFFLIPEVDRDEKLQPDFLEYIRTVVYQAYMWTYNNDRFMNGTATMLYRPDIRHGEPIWIGVGPGVVPPLRTHFDGRPDNHAAECPADALSESPQESDGGKTSFDGSNDYICAYVDTVSHSFEAEPTGGVKMRTTVTFQRGLFNDLGRTSPVYIKDEERWAAVSP